MPISIEQAKKVGDKKLHYGGDREFSLRSNIKSFLITQKKAMSPKEVYDTMELKKINITLKQTRQALVNLKSAKKIQRAVVDNTPYYYVVEAKK